MQAQKRPCVNLWLNMKKWVPNWLKSAYPTRGYRYQPTMSLRLLKPQLTYLALMA